MLHLICQQIWKTRLWPQDWKRSVFISIPKKGNAKECSNYCTIALISHANKLMLKLLLGLLLSHRYFLDMQWMLYFGWVSRSVKCIHSSETICSLPQTLLPCFLQCWPELFYASLQPGQVSLSPAFLHGMSQRDMIYVCTLILHLDFWFSLKMCKNV